MTLPALPTPLDRDAVDRQYTAIVMLMVGQGIAPADAAGPAHAALMDQVTTAYQGQRIPGYVVGLGSTQNELMGGF